MLQFASHILKSLGYRQASSDERARVKAAFQGKVTTASLDDKATRFGVVAADISEHLSNVIARSLAVPIESGHSETCPKSIIVKNSLMPLWDDFLNRISFRDLNQSGLGKTILQGINFAMFNITATLVSMTKHLEKIGKLTEENFSKFEQAGNDFIQEIAKLTNQAPLPAFIAHFLLQKKPLTHDLNLDSSETKSVQYLLEQDEIFDPEDLQFNDEENTIGIKDGSLETFIVKYKKTLDEETEFEKKDNLGKTIPVIGCPAKFIPIEIESGKITVLITAMYLSCFRRVKNSLFHSQSIWSTPEWVTRSTPVEASSLPA